MVPSYVLFVFFLTCLPFSLNQKQSLWDSFNLSKLDVKKIQENTGRTKINTIKFSYKWEIEDIHKFKTFRNEKLEDLKSPIFSVIDPDSNKEYFWSLGLYFYDSRYSGTYFGVYLMFESRDAENLTILKFTTINKNKTISSTSWSNKYFQNYGDKFNIEDYLAPDKVDVNDGYITILLEAETFLNSTDESKFDKLGEVNLNMKNLTDDNSLITSDLDHKMLQEILYFFYTGKTTNLNNMHRSLLMAGDNLKFRTLLEEKLLSKLNVETAADIYMFMYLHKKAELKLQVIDFIKKNALKVISTKGWMSLLNSTNPNMLAEIFSSFAKEVASKYPMEPTESPAV